MIKKEIKRLKINKFINFFACHYSFSNPLFRYCHLTLIFITIFITAIIATISSIESGMNSDSTLVAAAQISSAHWCYAEVATQLDLSLGVWAHHSW
jgi:hypothetical protein